MRILKLNNPSYSKGVRVTEEIKFMAKQRIHHERMHTRELLITPLIEERGYLVNTLLVNTGFAGHLSLRFFTDLLVIH